MRRSAIGPDLSHRRTLVTELLATAPVRSAILAEASIHGQAGAERRARKIIDRLSRPILPHCSFFQRPAHMVVANPLWRYRRAIH